MSGDQVVLDIAEDAVTVSRVDDGSTREIGRAELVEGNVARARSAVLRLLRRAKTRRAQISVRLTASQALRRTLDLPLATEENLREVLAFEMDRHTPFKADEVYYDHRVVERDAAKQRLMVELGVAPRRVIEEVLETASAWGVALDRVEIAGDDGAGGEPLNLLPREPAGASGASGGVMAPVLVIAAITFACVTVYLSLQRDRELAENWSEKVSEIRIEATATSNLRQEIDGRLKDSRFVLDKKVRSPMVLGVIDELTRLLPDKTYLFQLQLRDGEVQISGYSSAAAQLIGLLEKSPILGNAKFRSPVTQDIREGRERFQISAELQEIEN